MAGAREGRFGVSGLILKHSGEIVQDIYGEESGTCVFHCPPGRWDLMPVAGHKHPHASHMLLERRRVRFVPGFWQVAVDFRGVQGNPPPQYELNYGSGTEPIETHPDFESKIAGKPSAPKNGAVFVDAQGNVTQDDSKGVFERFLIKNPDNASLSFGGMDGYVDMNNITWTKTWVTSSMETTGGKVKIDTPEGGAPSFTGRDWLYLGMSSSGIRGGSARNRKTWRLSGPGGWNPVVYGD